MSIISFTDAVKFVGSATKKFTGVKKYVSTGAVDTFTIDENAVENVTFDTKPSRANLSVEYGDVLFAKMAGTLKTLIIDEQNKDYIYSTGFCAVSARTEIITPKCLYYLVSSDPFLIQKDKHSSGATQRAITSNGLQNIKINIPALNEQDNLVQKLDKLTFLMEQRKAQLKKLDDLVKSQFIEMFGDPENNTNDLPIYKLGDLCTVSSSKRIYQDELTTEGVPFLRVSDLNSKIDYDLDSYELFIPETIYNTLVHEKLVPTENDILITARGTLGKCYIVKSEDKFYFQDGMITWLSHLSEEITRIYLTHLFNMNGIKKQIKELQAGSTVAYLSIAMTKKLNIMLPPLNQQNEFARFVEQTDKSKIPYGFEVAA